MKTFIQNLTVKPADFSIQFVKHEDVGGFGPEDERVSWDYVVRPAVVLPAPGYPDGRLTNVYLVPRSLQGDINLRDHYLNVEFRLGITDECEVLLLYRVLEGGIPLESDCQILLDVIDALVPTLDDNDSHNPALDLLYSMEDVTCLLDSEIGGCFEHYTARSGDE